jgi:hypothetical protein
VAKLKATPKNYAEAVAVLKGKIRTRLGNNTYLELSDSDPVHGFIGVRLHDTYVVRFWADGQVTLHTGGYRTVTTKERINQFINGRVYAKNYQWFYCPLVDGRAAGELACSFGEGMNVQAMELLDQVDNIIAYENGELEEDEMIALFQELVNSGLAWQLQGHYGRTAKGLIEAGLVTLPRR